MNRISVIGTSGSGKTTFANKLAGILRIPHVELDALYWEANWEKDWARRFPEIRS